MIPMREKSKAFAAYVTFQSQLETQHGKTIKTLQSDNDGAFLSHEFEQYLQARGTVRRLTVHDTPEQNGVAERVHGTVLNGVRACLASSHLPKFLWGECLGYVTYIMNRTPHSALAYRSPFEEQHCKGPRPTRLETIRSGSIPLGHA